MAGDRRVTNGNGVNERFENNDGEQSDSNLRNFISQEFQNQRVIHIGLFYFKEVFLKLDL